jgi:hypothetical protein
VIFFEVLKKPLYISGSHYSVDLLNVVNIRLLN